MSLGQTYYEFKQSTLHPLLSPFRRGRVAMFHVGRSGSTVLADLLNQHRMVLWEGEIYERLFRQWERAHGDFHVGDPEPRLDPIKHVRSRMKRGGRRWYGFEVKFFRLDHAGMTLDDYVNGLRANAFERFIVLERKNYLRKIVSSVIAHQRGRFHIGSKENTKSARIRIDPSRVSIDCRGEQPLISYMEGYAAGFRRLRELLPRDATLDLSYEADIQADPSVAYQRAVDFLNIAPPTSQDQARAYQPLSPERADREFR